MANKLTVTALRGKWRGVDRWLSDGGSRGAGRLVAKLSKAGVVFYFAYFDAEDRRRFFPIGSFDWRGERGITLQKARDRAAELSRLYREEAKDLHAHFAAEEAARARARKAAEDAAKRADEVARRSTLRQLLDAYTAHLERLGKQAVGDARGIFNLHVYDAAPELAERRAAEIHVNEFVDLIGRLTEEGKGRTAAKLRSYLRAAYALAIKSKTDPAAPLALRAFGIEANPITSIGALSQFNRARDRTLSAEELRPFLARLDKLPQSVKRDALTLCLLLGGQRPTQLLRARPVDADVSAGTLTLYDPKGSRQQPRPHVLPLTKRATAIVRRAVAVNAEAPYLFTSDGKRGLRPETLSAAVAEIAADMVKAKEARERFELRDLRRTCETMLAALGVSSDVRAQLQSHGLGGVQQRHYDRHGYMLEKRAALEKWQRHLDRLIAGKSAKIICLVTGKRHARERNGT